MQKKKKKGLKEVRANFCSHWGGSVTEHGQEADSLGSSWERPTAGGTDTPAEPVVVFLG